MEENMTKKTRFIAVLAIILMVIGAADIIAQAPAVPKASGAIARTLRNMNVTIGNWWVDYDVNTYRTRSDIDERVLDFRKAILRENNFTMSQKIIASWGEMSQIASTSIMAGRPAASVFVLQPNWALALHRQNLLYPISNSRAVNWTGTSPIQWNTMVNEAFTYNRRFYAFSPEAPGGSAHAACVFWNKRLFREAGLDENLPYDLQKSGEWTWAKFLEIAKRLTRDINNDGRIDIYAMSGDLSTEVLDAFVAGNGANYVRKNARTGRLENATNDPAFLEAIQYFMRLRDEGVMMPKPEGSAWDWYKPMFQDGRLAMRIDQHYIADNDLTNMRDNWGMVLPPKGPRSRNYVVFNDENVMVIPSNTPSAQVDAILWAVQSWYTPVDSDWRVEQYRKYRDRRACDETHAMIRNPALWQWKYHLHVPGLNRGDIAWEMWYHEGDPAQLIEKVSQDWNSKIDDANKEIF
jgi:ABC-type glycerol-3-phosphate transport system substrate-binding protein